ncbi:MULTISPECIES: adenosylmethionine--8-amino-7-oxononanoate transaminase [unclassified Rhizobium]|uniref:adenosylmethionine--8-amino-7-oxononanoate transaminase n=1 Tax=unclassified Rhizobium TaxID=2613769 RepID=UPI00160FE2B2|nr:MULTISPECIES: adenosylmethionine--8-amino-7-oxononanoate transaminase [unclassified Rhizobium]MBB3318740.1 adenosylmethionine-8-amino-7-oxononanoate aminotransferase [Rhizobium sp. BK181]MBB3543073.1 adenosylmethionine-8-amino-7-oxononanoate aminotransferase [Rhizobium sp. BK399]MCS3742289.1 adenosylmethionine-8-amino-7-oxononanoate aminotransferase [Rhizobium sp. BK661]MCS4094883.1 adenosylmethionine-8-amino-7-oxononanoate aminotransferase [Rhizobium sp. BK176]
MTRSIIWHPFTQHALEPPMKRIVSTEGAYLVDEDGNRILDAISSWWVITHGHRHPAIMQAIRAATEAYDQIIFAEYSHEPAQRLAEGLVAVAPPGLRHVFYSDSGSTSVEVALKMALGFYHNTGEARDRIVVMEHGYHGDTIGTMSAGERGVFNASYAPLLFGVDRIPFPEPDLEQRALDAFEAFCRTGRIAAILLEPLVLGAGGMKTYTPEVLKALREIAHRHGCLVIADEVMTGWGRTGTMFACQQADVSPDILCTSKGLTGGALPLAATLCTSDIYEAHLSTDRRKTFFHSSSYTANPVACAAGVANLEVWKHEDVGSRIQRLGSLHRQHLPKFEDDDRFSGVRQAGTIVALDLDVTAAGYLAEVGPRMRRLFRERGFLIRPLGNVIYLMPPYCVSAPELSLVYDAIDEVATIIQGGSR